jgi:galactokinase
MDRLDDSIEKVYGALERERARRRCEYVSKKFAETFGRPAQGLFSAPGRTELGGNHTDHQRGHVLAAAVNMDMVAAASVTTDGAVRVLSEGYPMITVDLARRCPVSGEEGTSSSLIRGIAAKMAEISGCDISGVEVYIISDVPGGSGLSSSAAFEVLIGTVLNHLFFSEKFTDIQVAQIGQYAENRFFRQALRADGSAGLVGRRRDGHRFRRQRQP